MKSSEKYQRLFISIPLPNDLRNVFISFQKKLKKEKIYTVKSENLHITIQFLGNVHEVFIPELDKKITEILREIPSFTMHLKGTVFAPQKFPYMIWGEFRQSKEFNNLVEKLQFAIKDFIESPHLTHDKKIIPHVTLARFKHLEVIKKNHLAQDLEKSFQVNACQLISSELQRKGSVYTVLGWYPLN